MPGLRDLWGVLRRRALIIAFSLLFFAVLPCVLLLFVKPVFRASAQMKILFTDGQSQYLAGVPPDLARYEYAEKTKIDDTFFELVRNPESLRLVIADLHLSAKGGATLYPEDLLMGGVGSMLFRSEGVDVALAGNGAEIVEVVGYGPTPERAAVLANALTTRFTELYAQMFRSRARAAVRVLDARLLDVGEQLLQTQRAKVAFLRENGAVDLAAEQDRNLTAFYAYRDQLSQNAKQIVQAREEIAQIKATMGDIAQLQLAERAIERNDLINNYRNQIASLESALAGSLTELTAAHPANVAAQKRIESLRAALTQEIEKVLARETESRNPYYDDLIKRLNNDKISDQVYTALGEKLEDLLRETKLTMDRNLGLQGPVTELDRQTTALNTSYLELRRALNAAAQVAALSPTNVGMLNLADPAFVNPRKPYFPDWIKILALCPLLAAGVAFGLILVAEAMDRTFKTEAEARAALAEALLAGIPRQPRRFTRERAVGDIYREALLAPTVDCRQRFEAWIARVGVGVGVGNVLAGLRLGSDGGLPRAVLFTGAAAGCGTTTLAFCVAGALARAGRKVLLVGTSFDPPSGGAGLAATGSEGFVPTDLEGLVVLDPAATRTFLDACTPELLATLPYDHVVFDPGPLALRADALQVAKIAGTAVVCFLLGTTPREEVLSSLERLRGLVTGRVWGVLNKC